MKDQMESLDGDCKSGKEKRWGNLSRGGGQLSLFSECMGVSGSVCQVNGEESRLWMV